MTTSRRDFIRIAGAGAAVASAGAGATVTAAQDTPPAQAGETPERKSRAMKRPNVLLLYTDQQRWDTIAAAGYTHMHTPNLDALAARGVLFENAFVNNPVCMPSRQSMLSGRYPSVVGTCTNGVEMPQDLETLPKILGLYGYHTASIGKLHFLNHSNRDHREVHPSYGFDHLEVSDEPGCYDDAYIKWVEEQDPSQVENCRVSTPPAWEGKIVEKHPRNTHEPYYFEGPEDLTHTAFVASRTIDYIRQHRGEPFFCIAGFYAPHPPNNPPKRFVDMYDPAKLPNPFMTGSDRKKLGLTDAEWREVRAFYYGLVSHVDDQVGRILAALDEEGLAENTLIIFTSDHGEHLGDHGQVQKGPPGMDSCIHVPLLMAYSGGIPAGQRKQELIEAIDIGPTVLDYCGIQTPPGFQGRSFRGLIGGEAGEYKPRDSVFNEFRQPFGTSWKLVRTHEYKYCTSNSGSELLYDLKSDPHELNNVAEDSKYAEALHAMRNELVRRWFDVEKQYPLRTGAY